VVGCPVGCSRLERNQGRRCGGSEAVEGITPCGARELDWRFPGIEVGWILGIAPTSYGLGCRLLGEVDNCGAAGAGRGLRKIGVREITARNLSPTDSQLRAHPSSQ
jgi:hypothetical protein